MDKVAGNTVFRLKGYVLRQFGADTWSRIVDRLRKEEQPLLRGVVLSSAQYDRTLYQRLLGAIDAELGRPALLESARVQAEEQFSGFYGLVLRVVPTETVFNQASGLWRKNWTTGELVLTRTPDVVEVTIRQFEMPEVHRVHNESYFTAFLYALTHQRWKSESEARGPRESYFRYTRQG